jgi:hypothetical protein
MYMCAKPGRRRSCICVQRASILSLSVVFGMECGIVPIVWYFCFHFIPIKCFWLVWFMVYGGDQFYWRRINGFEHPVTRSGQCIHINITIRNKLVESKASTRCDRSFLACNALLWYFDILTSVIPKYRKI